MKKTKIAKIIALVLCAVLLLCACAPKEDAATPAPSALAGTEEQARRTIPFSQMKYERPDVEALMAAVDALTEKLKAAEDFSAAMQLRGEAQTLLDDFDTQYTLAYLANNHDINDTFYEEEIRYLDQEMVEVEQHYNAFNTQLVEGPFAGEFRAEVGENLFETIRMSLLFTNDAVKEYQKERNELNQDYTQMISTLTVAAADGEEYTLFEIEELDSAGLYLRLYQRYMQQYMEDFAQLYDRMVQLDKQTAYELGFEDAATMYYLQYNRDYGPADAKALFANVKEILVPAVPQGYYNAGAVEYDRAFAAMPQALAAFGPELTEAWDFMVENGLYDCAPAASKRQGVAFTTDLPSYDAPFVFSNYEGDFWAANTIVHEFGHFYDFWLHYSEETVFNLDVAETYSQALELLMQAQYGLFTENEAQAKKQVLQSMLENAIIWQSVLEDFQLRAYELETFDGAVLGRLFAQVVEEYGMDAYFTADAQGAVGTWLTVSHLFDAPFYTASYVTSATAALQIWAQAQTNWEGAVKTYQTLLHADQTLPYTALLDTAGLKPPQDEGVLRDIAQLYADAFADEAAPGGALAQASTPPLESLPGNVPESLPENLPEETSLPLAA